MLIPDIYQTDEEKSAWVTSELLGSIQQKMKALHSRRSETASQEPSGKKDYYTIGAADKRMFARFGYRPRTAQGYRNDPKYGFPPRIGTAKDRYNARKFDAAMERFEKKWFGK
jgi:hypothetical protein